MNVREDNYNIYLTKDRASEAVDIMRQRLGTDADHFDPHVIGKVAEGEAFGDHLNRVGQREYQEIILS